MARTYKFQRIAESERSELIYERIMAKSRIKKINRMLKSLRESGLYDESVAVENLFNYLSSANVNIKRTSAGNISIRGVSAKSMTGLTGINKAIDQFIKNKMSTVSGMKQLYEERRSELYNFIDDKEFVDSLSFNDIKNIYKVFQSNEYERSSRSFDSKSFFTLYTQAIDEKWNKDKFMTEANYYMDYGNDDDLKEDLSDIYSKFIERYISRSS